MPERQVGLPTRDLWRRHRSQALLTRVGSTEGANRVLLGLLDSEADAEIGETEESATDDDASVCSSMSERQRQSCRFRRKIAATRQNNRGGGEETCHGGDQGGDFPPASFPPLSGQFV